MGELVTTKDLAIRYRVCERTIDNWRRQGRIPSVRFGRRTVRFRLHEVEAVLASEARAKADG